MLRREGNVIGSPIEPNTNSATGVFRISAGQQNINLAKFPPHLDTPPAPKFVSILRGTYPETGGTNNNPVTGSGMTAGTIRMRIAEGVADWESSSSTNNAINQILETDTGNAGPDISGYFVEVTGSDHSSFSAGETRSCFGTLFVSAQYACRYTTTETIQQATNLPNFGTPLEYQDNFFDINLNSVNGSGSLTNRLGNTGLVGMPKDGDYQVTVYTQNAGGKRSTGVTSNKIKIGPRTDTSNLGPEGIPTCDILLIGGGAAAGECKGVGSAGAGGAASVVIAYSADVRSSGNSQGVWVGTGGVNSSGNASYFNANGGASSNGSLYSRGGGKGADAGFDGSSYHIVDASAGGCGGGSISDFYFSAGGILTSGFGEAGLAGNMTAITNGFSSGGFNGTNFSCDQVYVFENVGGGYQATANDTLVYPIFGGALSSYISNVVNGNWGGGGGGTRSPGNSTWTYGVPGNPGEGISVIWATPGVSSALPNLKRQPFNQQGARNIDGTNSIDCNGHYAAGGQSGDGGAQVAKGGPGLGNWMMGNRTSTVQGMDGSNITYNKNGFPNTGSGGGATHSSQTSFASNASRFGGNGADGICVIRFTKDWWDSRKSITTFSRPTALGEADNNSTQSGMKYAEHNGYIYVVWHGNGSITW